MDTNEQLKEYMQEAKKTLSTLKTDTIKATLDALDGKLSILENKCFIEAASMTHKIRMKLEKSNEFILGSYVIHVLILIYLAIKGV